MTIGKATEKPSDAPDGIQVGDTVRFKSSDTGLLYRVLEVNETTLRLTNPLGDGDWTPERKWFEQA